ncbi:MAG: response regulator, partial [Pseudomonadales bacterium]|nr:response regulator [Pseudomonadales bacterium]
LFLVSLLSHFGESWLRYDAHFATSITVAATMVAWVLVISQTSRRLHDTDLERAASVERLASVERRLRTTLDALPVATVVVDEQGIILNANPSAARLCNRGVSDLVGESLDRYVDYERPTEDVVLRRHGETDVRSECQVEVVTAPLEWDDVSGTLVALVDVTDRRALEMQLRQSQKLEAVGRLAGGVAHDFNNQLTAILGYVELALAMGKDESVQEFLVQAKVAAEKSAGLTGQLLAFGRKQMLQPQALDINDLLSDYEALLPRVIRETIDVSFDYAADLGTVMVDKVQMDQVIMNLVVNASDAMPDGGHLTLSTANIYLDESFSDKRVVVPAGEYVQFAVSDTGIGMSQDEIEKIFEPFYTTKPVGEGTGLGLSTVYGIVKQSGGFVWAYSEPGRGASFKVYLPRIDGAADEKHAQSVPDDVSTLSATVLVAEDQPQVRELLDRALTMRGCKVLAAPDGEAALDMAESYDGTIDVLVTDAVMPGIGGDELATELTRRMPALKVIFVSGYATANLAKLGIDPGSWSFLQKPTTPGAVVRKIQELLA